MEPLREIRIKAAVNRINAVLRELELNDAEIRLIMECYDEVLNQRNRNHTKPYKLTLVMSFAAFAISTLSLILRLLTIC